MENKQQQEVDKIANPRDETGDRIGLQYIDNGDGLSGYTQVLGALNVELTGDYAKSFSKKREVLAGAHQLAENGDKMSELRGALAAVAAVHDNDPTDFLDKFSDSITNNKDWRRLVDSYPKSEEIIRLLEPIITEVMDEYGANPHAIEDIGTVEKYIAVNDNEKLTSTRRHTERLAIIFNEPSLRPLPNEFEVKGREFATSSRVRTANGREIAILFTENIDGDQDTRLLYKSKSDGGWRAASGVEIINGKGIRYIKGADRHYTQETKLADEIIDKLEASPLISDNEAVKVAELLHSVETSKEELPKEIYAQFERESTVVPIDGPVKFLSEAENGSWLTKKSLEGHSAERLDLHGDGALDNLAQLIDRVNKAMIETSGFLPDFSKNPVKVVVREHTLLGEVTYRRYEAKVNGRVAYWDMGDDGKGNVWVDQIRYSDVDYTSYGTPAEVIDSGILTTKPIEYSEQATALDSTKASPVPGTDGKYVFVTPVLDKFIPIKSYKEAIAQKQ